ncbi:MAG: hypothetical protein ABI760_11605, partial [Ferruginibacter sp.]
FICAASKNNSAEIKDNCVAIIYQIRPRTDPRLQWQIHLFTACEVYMRSVASGGHIPSTKLFILHK